MKVASCWHGRVASQAREPGQVEGHPLLPRGSGDVTAAQFVKLSSGKTINGQDLKLTVNEGTVMGQ